MRAHVHEAACARSLTHGAPSVLHHAHEMGGSATTTTGEHAAAACHRPSSPPNEALAVATTPMPSAKLAPPTNDERRRRRSRCHGRRTHHGRATIAAIRAAHHVADVEHIPDLLRSGHTRRVFLARHQQIQLHPAPIVAHFRCKPSHRLIWIFMAHSTDFDPRMDQRQRSTRRFLLESIRPSIFPKASVFISTPTSICQHAHKPARCHGHRLARANCRRCCARTATAT
ncbi:hypothetical protein ACLOJK_006904, partial [Asimina triloba]